MGTTPKGWSRPSLPGEPDPPGNRETIPGPSLKGRAVDEGEPEVIRAPRVRYSDPVRLGSDRRHGVGVTNSWHPFGLHPHTWNAIFPELLPMGFSSESQPPRVAP